MFFLILFNDVNFVLLIVKLDILGFCFKKFRLFVFVLFKRSVLRLVVFRVDKFVDLLFDKFRIFKFFLLESVFKFFILLWLRCNFWSFVKFDNGVKLEILLWFKIKNWRFGNLVNGFSEVMLLLVVVIRFNCLYFVRKDKFLILFCEIFNFFNSGILLRKE